MKLLLFPFTLFVVVTGFGQVEKYPLIALTDVPTTEYDTFRIKATVKNIYVCPPCPKGATCKPCVGNHLTVGAKETQLMVLTESPAQFKLGKSYLFLVKLVNKAHREFGTALIASQ